MPEVTARLDEVLRARWPCLGGDFRALIDVGVEGQCIAPLECRIAHHRSVHGGILVTVGPC